METEDMRVLKLKNGVGIELPRVPEIPLLSDRILIVRIHDATSIARQELSLGWRNGRERIDAKTPVRKLDSRTRHDVSTGNTEHTRKDRRVDLLDHKQRNVQESLSV